jgi:hypothetical protein
LQHVTRYLGQFLINYLALEKGELLADEEKRSSVDRPRRVLMRLWE